MSAVKLGLFIQIRVFGAAVREAEQQLLADVGMCHFAAAEANSDLHAVAVGKEFHRAAHFGVEVVGVDARGHADLLDLDDVLVLLRFFFLFQLFEAEFAVIHDLADWGDGDGGDLHEIKLLLLGKAKRLCRRNDADHAAVCVNQTNLFVLNFFVELMI